MPISVTNLSELDEELVAQMYAEATTMMGEAHPEIELASGPFRTLVLYFAAVFSGVNQTNVDLLRKSQSLLAIDADPTGADPTVVDGVLSNHLVTRKVGTTAAGLATIIVAANVPVVISAEAVFTANGQTFRPGAVYIGRPAGTVVNSNDRELTALGDGTYSFTIPLTADVVGVSGNVRRGTTLTPLARPENFVRATAGADFSGGFDTELNSELTARLREGMAAKSMGGQLNWEALIKSQTQFEQTLHYAVLGFGDPEQHRDQHTIWPGSLGGRVDIYAQTAELPTTSRIKFTATLVDIVGGGSVWQTTINRDTASGFYEVLRALPLDAGPDDVGYEITLDERGIDLTSTGFVPDVTTPAEGAYSLFQTAIIQFRDTDTPTGPLTLGDTAEYYLDISAMPQIAALQDFCSNRLVRPRACDILVRAAVPCTTSVSFDVRTPPGEAVPDTAAMAAAIAAAVNKLGFIGQLHASLIADVAHNYLVGRQALGRIQLAGRIRAPGGRVQHIRATDILRIPDNPADCVTGNTTIFMLDPQDIDITVVPAGYTEN